MLCKGEKENHQVAGNQLSGGQDTTEIRLLSTNGRAITDPSGSQLTTMYMSVLFAISDLTSSKRDEDYPLIFDAPTSSFGGMKESGFYNIIDSLEKQCIIVTKDFLDDQGNIDEAKIDQFGQAIKYWGNIETRGIRQTYGAIRDYIFAALIAKTDIDLITLDKGDPKVTPRKVVDALVGKMEEYANFGLYYMEEQMIDNPDYFFRDKAFLRLFLQFIPQQNEEIQKPEAGTDDLPEEL